MEAKINHSYAETLFFVSIKGCSPVEVKFRKTKENGISHLRENGPQLSEEQDSIQDSLFGRKVDFKNFFVLRSSEKSFLGLLEGVWAMLRRKILKR